MKKIVCYGDSNTFGYNSLDSTRFDDETRWTALLQNSLGNDYEIIEEGMCDRTGFVDNDKGFLFSSQKHFPKMIAETKNIDILILWIGTNDLQFKYNTGLEEIKNGLSKLLEIAKNYAEKIIIIPPVEFNNTILEGNFNVLFDETCISKSKKAIEIYKKLAQINHCDFLNINEFVKPASIDGLHYDNVRCKITVSLRRKNNKYYNYDTFRSKLSV